MKKILILYTSVGGGHFRAAEGIKKYIDDKYPNDFDVELIDGLHYVSKAVDKVIIKSYVGMARYSPKSWDRIYKIGNSSKSLSDINNNINKVFSYKLLQLFKRKDPAIVISTHYFMTEMVTNLKRKKKTNAKLAVILTDYASHKFWESHNEYVDLYFVANNQMKYTLIHDGISRDKIHVTGIPVRPEFKQTYDRQKTLSELGLSPDKTTFLIFGGGQYGMSDSSLIFKGILNVKQDIQIIAIAGKSQKTKESFEELAKNSNKSVVVLGFIDKVAELMYASDFVVSKPGGLTTTEILVTNRPFIIFSPVPGQEEENSSFLTNYGAGFRIWDLTKTTPLVEELLTDEFHIENMKTMQKHIAKPDSTRDIVDIILRNI